MLTELFDIVYTEAEKDVFTWALHLDNQIKKTRLNPDSSVIVITIPKMGTYCTVYMDFDNVYFKNFSELADAIVLHDKIVGLYEKG